MIPDLSALHLLRPHWLWALLALPLLGGWWRSRQRRASAWRGAVDAHLLPHLLDAAPAARGQGALLLGALGYVLAVLALAGPSWRQVDQPLWQSGTPLVVALDLSSAAMTADLPPSRLAQARAKLSTLLRERKDGQVGLVAYAGDAFTVAPLTDDAANVALFLDALNPDVMPVDGQRSDRAIVWSTTLLQRAGFHRGDIVLLTDHADGAAKAAASKAAAAGYRVSVIGLGSETGGPYRSPDGAIANARLDAGSLRALARAGNGHYAALAPDDADLRALGVLTAGQVDTGARGGESGRSWADDGYWLLPPLMLLALLAFRRSGAVAVLLVCLWLPWQPAQAADWWRRPDQVDSSRMQQGAQAYRKGDFQHAAQLYDGIDTAQAHYNRGNALAKSGQYPQAIEAYDRALREQPGMADALANKRVVQAAMQKKPAGSKSGQQPPQPGGQKNPGQPGADQNGDTQSQDGQPQSPSASQPPPPQTPPPPQAGQNGPSDNKPPPDTTPADAQAQQAADAAQRARMQQALQQAGKPAAQAEKAKAEARETPLQREHRLANEAWLKRVPDDPGGLLRAKFRIEYERRQVQGLQGE